ncbi:MAG: SDR family NAD(P)-dependent oxidoreductase, partial [Candidatus Sulfotelmatobacter sp.]
MGYKRLELDGKVAVVIGGSSGIGRTLARGLAEAGADVVASARRMELVNAVADEIESLGRRSLRLSCDVADRGSLEKLLKASVQELGKVDILVNAAGFNQRAPTLDFSEADWDKLIDTNLTGTLRACQIFGRHMIERKYGRIINIASMGSFLALYEVAAYCASKAGVASITFVTILTRYREAGREAEGERSLSVILTTMYLVLGAAVVLAEIFAPWYVHWWFSGFDAKKAAQCVELTRILLPAQLCFFAGGVFGAVLLVRKQFSVQAVAPLIYGLGTIVGGLLLIKSIGVSSLA